MFRYYGKRSHMTADLKRVAHAVRHRVDAIPMPVDGGGRPIKEQSPRRKRLIVIASATPLTYAEPYLAPLARHRLAWETRRVG